jgi:hypothetical protein
LLEIFSTLEE